MNNQWGKDNQWGKGIAIAGIWIGSAIAIATTGQGVIAMGSTASTLFVVLFW